MARPINLERLAERESKARLNEEKYRLRRIRESKAFHSAQGKEHTKRLSALGQLVEDLFPDKTVTEIASLLNIIVDNHWIERAQQAEDSGYLGVGVTDLAIHELEQTHVKSRHKKTTFKDYSDTVIPPEARDDAVEVIE